MLKTLPVIFFLFTNFAYAKPDKIDVIFLSHSYTSFLQNFVQPKYFFMKRNLAVSLEEAKENCVPMGEGCFHPQYGFIEEETEKKAVVDEEPKDIQLRTINAMETNLVDCKKGNYFDIFCGKAKKEVAPAPIELWVDISSSMRNVDQDNNSKTCYRKIFVNNILNQCPKNKVDVLVYNNSKKLMDASDTLCLSYGMNSPKRFREWIDASTAKHLFIITDIDEMNQELSAFLEERGANITGIGAKDFSAKNLEDYAKEFLKTCQKI